eukprot:NODE_1610_length_1885_cov_252.028944_g1360_i0.p1 GENE.NODE_1610_length_1885_cov_252.028944_g1360_i0~~NODE_1610_length_1885_cov_252.028944_g1360_i0.p1  ORF type:complete len:561 (-),score=76.51 NODE_1610_length_1885_cov_252.028944_g1360_i0:148-1830(-)
MLFEWRRTLSRYRRSNRTKCFIFSAGFMALFFIIATVTQSTGHTPTQYTKHREMSRLEDVSGGFSILGYLDGDQCSRNFHPFVASVLWTLGILWMFLAIAIVCDDFFVSSLEAISEALNLSDDVAGATFMAAGSSAPELFTSVAGVFFVKDIVNDNPGAGTIVGSAVFNIAIIIGASVICAGVTLELDWWPLARDGTYYIIAVLLLITSFSVTTPNQVDWWEGGILVLFYLGYCTLMKYNQKLSDYIKSKRPPKATAQLMDDIPLTNVASQDLPDRTPADEENPNDDRRRRTSSLLTRQYANRVHLSKKPEKLSSPEVERTPSFRSAAVAVMAIERMKSLTDDKKTTGAPQRVEAEVQTDPIEEEEEGVIKKLLYVLSWPFIILFKYTIPDCKSDRWKKYYMLSFFVSIFWIAAISYIMVEFGIKMGRCFHLSTNLMGLTVLAAGTSVPDCLCSMLVAKNGQGNMAVSNAIGSNVFDILLGLGLPWLLSGTVVRPGIALPISTEGLLAYTLMLFAVLFIFLGLVRFSKWSLKVWHGYVFFVVYGIYCVVAISIDKKIIKV